MAPVDDQMERIRQWNRPPSFPAVRSAWVEAHPKRFGFITARLARRFVEAALPCEESGAPSGPKAVERVVGGMERIAAYFLPTTALGLRMALVALELLVMPLGPSWRPFSLLPLAKRRALLDRWLEGPSNFKRNLVRAIYLSVVAVYYSQPDVWESLEYDPNRWFSDRRHRRQELLREHDHSME